MSDLDQECLDAIERRLAARTAHAPPTGHRDRVLAAVRGALAHHSGPHRAAAGIDAGGAVALIAITLSALVAVVAPWLGLARGFDPLPAEPRIVMQARAAGIDLPLAAVATTGDLPRHVPAAAALPDLLERRRLEAWRLHKNLLRGEL